jgi:hypothetical protein
MDCSVDIVICPPPQPRRVAVCAQQTHTSARCDAMRCTQELDHPHIAPRLSSCGKEQLLRQGPCGHLRCGPSVDRFCSVRQQQHVLAVTARRQTSSPLSSLLLTLLLDFDLFYRTEVIVVRRCIKTALTVARFFLIPWGQIISSRICFFCGCDERQGHFKQSESHICRCLPCYEIEVSYVKFASRVTADHCSY